VRRGGGGAAGLLRLKAFRAACSASDGPLGPVVAGGRGVDLTGGLGAAPGGGGGADAGVDIEMLD
jgi:hypothetical protein